MKGFHFENLYYRHLKYIEFFMRQNKVSTTFKMYTPLFKDQLYAPPPI